MAKETYITRLTGVFEESTGIKRPDFEKLSPTGKRGLGAAWLSPMKDMMVVCDNNEERVAELIPQVVTQMRGSRMQIYNPRSILNIFVAVASRPPEQSEQDELKAAGYIRG